MDETPHENAATSGSVVDMTGMKLDEPAPEPPPWHPEATREAERLELMVLGLGHALDIEDGEGFASLAGTYAHNMVHGVTTGNPASASREARALASLLHGLAIAMPFADRLMDDLVKPLNALAAVVDDLAKDER